MGRHLEVPAEAEALNPPKVRLVLTEAQARALLGLLRAVRDGSEGDHIADRTAQELRRLFVVIEVLEQTLAEKAPPSGGHPAGP